VIKKLICGIVLIGAVTGGTLAPAGAQVGVDIRFGPPPAPIVERIPPPPGPEYAWQGGYWHWNGYRYVWYGGHYYRRPYTTAHWVPEHYVRGPEGHWHLVSGHWAG
jgi:hypothetical protein